MTFVPAYDIITYYGRNSSVSFSSTEGMTCMNQTEKPVFPMYYSRFANFGDLLNEMLVGELFGVKVKQEFYTTADLIGCGSILDRLLDNSTLSGQQDRDRRVLTLREKPIHVWGGGFMYQYKTAEQKPIRPMIVHALRGERTRRDLSAILGEPVDCVLGDPGLLAARVLPAEEKRWDYGILPHFMDAEEPVITRLMAQYPNSVFIDAKQRPELVLKQISQCRRILSTSLHGLIVADSYGIPNCWCRASDKLMGGSYKFLDYFSSFGTEREVFDLRSGAVPDPEKDFCTSYAAREELEKKQEELLACFPRELLERAEEADRFRKQRIAKAKKQDTVTVKREEIYTGVMPLKYAPGEMRDAVWGGCYPVLASLQGRGRVALADLSELRRESAYLMDEMIALPHYWKFRQDALKFTVNNLVCVFRDGETDFDAPEIREHYEAVQSYFHWDFFRAFASDLHPEQYSLPYLWFLTVRDAPYEDFCRYYRGRAVISLTSFPARVRAVTEVLKLLLKQSVQADRILLWLAEDQFPRREKDLPEELLLLGQDGKVEIRWCADLRPHKKYFYTVREMPDTAVITVDDDMRISGYQTEILLLSYARHPDCVSTMRAHFIPTDDSGNIPPYESWALESDVLLDTPCMQLLATGVGGVLYPPGCFPEEMLDEEAIREGCLNTDDLWLKAMTLVHGVPVVIAAPWTRLYPLEGSQTEALWKENVGGGGNDSALEWVRDWVDTRYGEGTFRRQLMSEAKGFSESGFAASCGHFSRYCKRLQARDRAQKAETDAQKKRNRQLEKQKQDLKKSVSFRLGRIITWLPRKLKKLLGK